MDRQMSDALRTCHGFCAPEGRITWHGNSPRRSPTSRSLLTPLLAGLKHQSLQHKGAAQREHAEDDILSDEEEEQCFTDSMEEEEEQHPIQRRYSTGAIPITNARRDYSHLIRKIDYERQCQQLLALAAKHSEALARQQGLRERNSVSAQPVQIRG